MTKLLRTAILISVIPVLAFGQRGGGSRGGGGGSRSGGGGARIGGGSAMRGGSIGGGFRGGSIGGGFRSSGGFRGNTIVRGGRFGNTRFFGGRYYSNYYLGFGYGGYLYYPYAYYPYSYDPYYYGSYYGAPYYNGGYYDNGYYGNDVGYVQQAPPAQPAPPTVINQNIGTPSAGASSGSFFRAADYYLIAFNDHTIRAALSYTVDGDQLRYTTREHEEKTAPLSSIDVRFSEQINRDRRVEFRLP
jgi:hypothetical protein